MLKFFKILLFLALIFQGCSKKEKIILDLREYLPKAKNKTYIYEMGDSRSVMFKAYQTITDIKNECVYYESFMKPVADIKGVNEYFGEKHKTKFKYCATKNKIYGKDRNKPFVSYLDEWTLTQVTYEEDVKNGALIKNNTLKPKAKKQIKCKILNTGKFDFKGKSYDTFTTYCGTKSLNTQVTYAKSIGRVKTLQFVNKIEFGKEILVDIKE